MAHDTPITIHTDGACSPNPGAGGWAAVLTSGERRKELSGGFRHTTNNRMELWAILEALKAVKGTGRRITLVSDSRYALLPIERNDPAFWATHGFRKRALLRGQPQPIKNEDIWRQLTPLLLAHTISSRFILGHSGHVENERCDRLAVAARLRGNLPEDVGYLVTAFREEAAEPEMDLPEP